MTPDDLRPIALFDGLDHAQLQQLVDAGEPVECQPGDVVFEQGEPAESWWVLIDGELDLLRRTEHDLSVVARMAQPGAWAGGFLAWTDAAGYMATGRAATVATLLRVPSEAFGAMVSDWSPFGVHLIRGFFQTVRNLEAQSRQRESLVALGTMAAGLAHEINNPASAAVRAVSDLQETSREVLQSLVQLAEHSLPAAHFVAIDEIRREVQAIDAVVDPIALADREEELLTWLDERDVADAWRIAPTLASAGFDATAGDRLAAEIGADTLPSALAYIASTLATAALLDDVKESTARVSNLVSAVKNYTQLDRSAVQTIDVTEGLESTLVMLGHKLGSIDVRREFGADVPMIEAIPAELNQVWTNLVDNAIDAMDGVGELRLSTRPDGDRIVVEIGDTGPGMPTDVQARAFEPFFTTKDVGKGTGLGLDISRRIVADRHHGEITIESSGTGTTMVVRLPRSRAR